MESEERCKIGNLSGGAKNKSDTKALPNPTPSVRFIFAPPASAEGVLTRGKIMDLSRRGFVWDRNMDAGLESDDQCHGAIRREGKTENRRTARARLNLDEQSGDKSGGSFHCPLKC